MQSFFVNREDFLQYVGEDRSPGILVSHNVNVTTETRPRPTGQVNFVDSHGTYVALPRLEAVADIEMSFMFKTRDSEGLMFYSGGRGEDFFAIELVNGRLSLIVRDDADSAAHRSLSRSSLSDNHWHQIKIKRKIEGSFILFTDEEASVLNAEDTMALKTLDTRGQLYVGGLPNNGYDKLPSQVLSSRGYKGCLASVVINRRQFDLIRDALAQATANLRRGCSVDAGQRPCSNHELCLNDGVCVFEEGIPGCNCDMSAHVGEFCTEEAEGYNFAENWYPGIVIYNYDNPTSTSHDQLAFGFMTNFPSGTMVRIDSGDSTDYIDAGLVDGHVVVEYDIGGTRRVLLDSSRNFSDGSYHRVWLQRRESATSMHVDRFAPHHVRLADAGLRLFNQPKVIKVGGNTNMHGDIVDFFDGLIAGVFFNGVRVIDRGHLDDQRVTVLGDTRQSSHPYRLVKAPKPADAVLSATRPAVPSGETDPSLPAISTPTKRLVSSTTKAPHADVPSRGSGVAWHGSFHDLIVVVEPGGLVNRARAAGSASLIAAIVNHVTTAGGRVSGTVGLVIGMLMAAMFLAWAFYRCKPGLLLIKNAIEETDSGKGTEPRRFSSPKKPVINVYSPSNEGSIVSNCGSFPVDAELTTFRAKRKKTVVSSSDCEARDTSGYDEDPTDIDTQTIDDLTSDNSIDLRALTSSRYTLASTKTDVGVQTDVPETSAAPLDTTVAVPRSPIAIKSPSTLASVQTAYSTVRDSVGLCSSSEMLSVVPRSRLTNEPTGQQTDDITDGTKTFQQSRRDSRATARSSERISRNFQSLSAAQHGNLLGGSTTEHCAAEELRVDTALFTADGQYVVTGSIFGPPQVWDTQTGKFMRAMKGEKLSSTDLHLACGDSLIVGQVAKPSIIGSTPQRKLQIWDFSTGQPLSMSSTGTEPDCTATCLMQDGRRLLIGQTETPTNQECGDVTLISIWDAKTSEPLHSLSFYHGACGVRNTITFLAVSMDGRFAVCGFHNSNYNDVEYAAIELSRRNAAPTKLSLPTKAECAAVLVDSHELVTGMSDGRLMIWSLKTGGVSRHLVTAGTDTAHSGTVNAVTVSSDASILVSASGDRLVKVWSLRTERLFAILRGHSDQVLCTAISSDNDLVVSGSKDTTIRLWKLASSVPTCVYGTGVDVFDIKISPTKKTVVAIGDKLRQRKLFMLQIVTTKTRSRVGSRATSPSGSVGLAPLH